MKTLELSLGCCNYDRTRAIFDGRVAIEGCNVVPIALEPEETFHRVFQGREFDICEMSLSSHTLNIARGTEKYVAVPAFLSRAFRHAGIYIRTDRGIAVPADLRGKRVGIPEYQITANVWIRGMLQDEYGIHPREIRWRRGGLEQPGRRERSPISLPPDIEVEQVADDASLSQLLAAGELDAVFSAKAPSSYTLGAPAVGRLFPDYRTVEQDYFARTRLFPPMHVVGIRKTLVEQHPWLPVSVFKAFIEAKSLAIKELAQIGHFAATLPWGVAELEATRKLMGEDYWSYGLAANLHALETFVRYHHEQGISPRQVKPAELFAVSALDMARN